MHYPKKPGFNLYQSRHCAYLTYSVKTWFLKILSINQYLFSLSNLSPENAIFFAIRYWHKIIKKNLNPRPYELEMFCIWLYLNCKVWFQNRRAKWRKREPPRKTGIYFGTSCKGSRKKTSSINGRAIKRGGGRAIKEKITFFNLFFLTFQNFNGN